MGGLKTLFGKIREAKGAAGAKVLKGTAKNFYKSIQKMYRNDKEIREACDKMLEAIDKENEDEIRIQGVMIQGLINAKSGRK